MKLIFSVSFPTTFLFPSLLVSTKKKEGHVFSRLSFYFKMPTHLEMSLKEWGKKRLSSTIIFSLKKKKKKRVRKSLSHKNTVVLK